MKLRIEKTNIVKPMLMYWIVLVIYKACFPLEAKSTIDLIVKSIMLIYLVYAFVRYPTKKSGIRPVYLLFLLSLIIPFFHESYTAKNVVFYAFMVLFSFLTLGSTKQYIITKEQLMWFYNTIIAVMVIASVYSFIFETNKFLSARGFTSAYGNELQSFFDSSHVYGLYLSGAIIACLISLDQVDDKKRRRKYYFSLAVLAPNLIFTFSRTAIFSTGIFVIIYIFLGKNRVLKRMVILLAAVVAVFLSMNPSVQRFITNIVFKAGNLAGRDTLFNASMNIYKQSPLFDKIFGIGLSNLREKLIALTNWESTHNAFIEILIAFGVVGVVWFVVLFVALTMKYIRLFAIDKKWAVDFICLLFWCIAMMMANTFIIFTSSVDSYFLTIFSITVPMFFANTLMADSNSCDYV